MKRFVLIGLVAAAAGIGWSNAQPAKTSPAYYVAEFELTDAEGIKPYSAQVEASFTPFSGRYIVRGGTTASLEGQTVKGRMIVIAFDSLEKARSWYNSPAYEQLKPFRLKSGITRAYIVEGLPQ